jgi:hypothetical protein
MRHKLSTLKKEDSGVKIIICRKFHDEFRKVRALVNSERGKWMLWEISDESADIMSRLRDYFGEEEKECEDSLMREL